MQARKRDNFKIGIFRALYLGDLMCIIPTVRALRAAYPRSTITLIGLPWQQHLVERFQHYFDAFVEFPGWPDLPEQAFNPRKTVAFLKYMQDQRYDLLLQMQGNGQSTNAMCMLFGARKICGLRKPLEFCPDEKFFPVSEDDEHEVLRFLKLLKALDVNADGVDMEFPLFPQELENGKQLLEQEGLWSKPYICVHPGARDPKRRWSATGFATVADRLAAQGFGIVLTGSGEEAAILEQVSSSMRSKAINSVKAFGHLPLGELAGLIHYSSGLLSNDTGVSHIASALKTPSVVIFSEHSMPGRWAPLNRERHRVISPQESDIENVFQEMSTVLKTFTTNSELLSYRSFSAETRE